jgi:NUMOD4 motif
MGAARVSAADHPAEVWADVAGFKGFYRVSSRGRVASVARTVPVSGQSPRRLQGHILKPAVRPNRRLVTLSRDGTVVARTVERLMHEAGFRG